MMRFAPLAAALASTVGLAYAGHMAGKRYGHGTIGGIAGGIAGLFIGNEIAAKIESSAGLLGTAPPVEGTPEAEKAPVIVAHNIQKMSNRSKRIVADVVVNAPALVNASGQPGNTGPVTEAFTSEVIGGRAN